MKATLNSLILHHIVLKEEFRFRSVLYTHV